MRLSAILLLACCAAVAVAVRVDLAKKPTTSMGKAFQSIDNNLVGLINCAARRSQRTQASSFIEETPCATAQAPAQSAATTVVAVANAPQTVIPVIESAPVIESQRCAQKSQQAAASDVTARELAEYFESVNGGNAIKGDDIMKLCKHAGGPFAGVFRKIRKAATGLAAAIEGLLPLFKAKEHDQVDEAEAGAPAVAAIASAIAGSAAAPAPVAATAVGAAPVAPVAAPVAAAPAAAAPAAPAALIEVASMQPVAANTRRKIRFDREHKPISEAVCDFLVRHVNDLSDVCPDAARDEDGNKIVTGLIGHALAVALRG